MTLAEFLLARIAEDEAVARAASTCDEDRRVPTDVSLYYAITGENSDLADLTAHMRRHDPARVLADCEAKRWIVKQAEVWESLKEFPEGKPQVTGAVNALRAVLRSLSLPFADLPDYDPTWKVEP